MVKLVKITSNSNNISYAGFNGDISYSYENPKGYSSSPKQTYLMVKLNIVQTDENGGGHPLMPIVNAGTRAVPTAVSIPFLNNNFIAGLFSNLAVSINDKPISLVQNIGSVSTLFRSLYESKQENLTSLSLCSIDPMNQIDIDTTPNKGYQPLVDYFGTSTFINNANVNIDWSGGGALSLTNHQLYALKKMYMFNRFNNNEILLQIPASLFLGESEIPSGVKIDVKFTVDPNYATNVINIAGSNVSILPVGNATNYTITSMSSANSNVGTINSLAIGVVDMQIWSYCIKKAVPRSIDVPLRLKQWSTTQIAIPNGSTGPSDLTAQFVKDRVITHVCLAFVQNKGTVQRSTTDLSAGFFVGTCPRNNATGLYLDTPNANATTEAMYYTNSPIAQLINLRIQINSQSYPETPYTFQNDFLLGRSLNALSTSNSQDSFRAYMDFVDEVGLFDRSGCMSYDQWLIQPIFVFKITPTVADKSNVCTITYGFKSGVSNANILACAFYDETVEIKFDHNGDPVQGASRIMG
jgi:hypothetical protein